MEFIRDEDKNIFLKQRPGGRGVGFEDIERAIREQGVSNRFINDNPKYHPQEIFIVFIDDYPYKVPFTEQDGVFYLITAYPSRKFKS